jgi:hypothetical protein
MAPINRRIRTIKRMVPSVMLRLLDLPLEHHAPLAIVKVDA